MQGIEGVWSCDKARDGESGKGGKVVVWDLRGKLFAGDFARIIYV